MLLHCLMALLILSLSLPLSLYLLLPLFFHITPHNPSFSVFICIFFCLPPTHYLFVLILSHSSQSLLPVNSPCILCPCTSCLHLCFSSSIPLSAATLWRCSDLQPSLDRVRSASTTCLRPDTNFHSPDRDRYKKKKKNMPVCTPNHIHSHILMDQVNVICTFAHIMISYYKDEYRHNHHRLLKLSSVTDSKSVFFWTA